MYNLTTQYKVRWLPRMASSLVSVRFQLGSYTHLQATLKGTPVSNRYYLKGIARKMGGTETMEYSIKYLLSPSSCFTEVFGIQNSSTESVPRGSK